MKLTNKQKQIINRIGQQYQLKLMVLHGSYVTGKQRPGSDLDIAYLPKQPLDFDQQLALHSDLADIFGDNGERELDLKSLRRKDPLFIHEVARDSQLLYGTQDNYVDFKLHAAARFDDNRTIFDLESILTNKMLRHLKKRYA